MPKILIFANDESTIYNFRREILKAFRKEDYEVVLCMPEGQHTQEIEECGCRIEPIEMSRHGTNPVQDLKLLSTCKKKIRQHHPDVVLTYTVKPNVYGSIACQLTKTPYINNVTGLGSVLQKESILTKILLLLQKFAYRKSSCVFFQNEDNCRVMQEKGVIGKNTPIEILPGSGVNLELHSYEPMPVDDGTVRFIIVSRIREDKGYNEFFDAAEQVKQEYPNTEFHVVGWYENDSFKKRVEELAASGVIVYHGKQVQEDVHKLVAACDCSVLPSYHEGMANVLLEAAATGRPVIATRIPGCKETFTEGETGFGCDVKSTSSLKKAMIKVYNLSYAEREQMGYKGREKMVAEFDRKFVAERYLKYIAETIEK